MTPKRDILMDGLRRDQIYTRAKESEEERKGMVSSGEMICTLVASHRRMRCHRGNAR